MKFKTIVAATAAIVFAGNVAAQATANSSLNESGGGDYLGALPVGIVANPLLRDALQGLQLDASCVGEDTKACMPSISTIELASLMQNAFGDEWGNYQVDAFGTGQLASAVVCGALTDEATRVAARHVGIGCTASNPEGGFTSVASTFQFAADAASCLNTVTTFTAGGIGFATADSQSAAYKFIKLDGESPDLANFIAGNYAMFADVHGGSLTGNNTAQPFGDTGAVPKASNPPMHADAGNFNASNECASGRLRNQLGGNLAE
jgi:hypothetical protein